jgi:hypothetical protein
MSPPDASVVSSGTSSDLPVTDTPPASAPATQPPAAAGQPASTPPADGPGSRFSLHTSHEIATDAFAHLFEGTTLFPKGVLGPLYTGYTGRIGFDYRFSDGLRPFLTLGGGNFHTESPAGRTVASGGRFVLETGFLLNEEPALSFGNPGTGFLGGYHQVGFGFNYYTFDAPNTPGLSQLSIINRRPFFQGQIPSPIGHFVLGLNLLSSSPAFPLSDSQVPGCPGGLTACSTQRVIPTSNLVPFSFSLSLEPNSSPVLRTNYGHLYSGELAPRIVDLTTRQISDYLSIQDVPRYANTRLLLEAAPLGSADSASSSSLARVGMDLSFLGLTFNQGRYAADLSQLIRRGDGVDKGLLIGSQAAMNIALWAMCGTSADYPSGTDILAGRFGAITDFSGRGACIQAPVNTMALGLGILDGFDAMGDPNGSTGTQAWFWTSHGIAAAVGLVGLVNYVRPFGSDPDTIAFSGGRGVITPSQRLPELEHRFRDNALLTLPLTWAVFSYLNRRSPLTFNITPSGDGAVGTVSGRLP